MKSAFAITLILVSILVACNTKQDASTEVQEKTTLNKFLTEQEGYVKIPLNQLVSGHLSIVTRVNNIKGRFILDTGSSSTIINQKHKKKFRLVTKDTKKIAKTAGGTQLRMQVSLDNIIEFSKLKLHNVKISLVNINHINYSFQSMGMLELDGIIGSDLLKDRKAIIDYDYFFRYNDKLS